MQTFQLHITADYEDHMAEGVALLVGQGPITPLDLEDVADMIASAAPNSAFTVEVTRP